MATRWPLLWTISATGAACSFLVLLWALPQKDGQRGSDGNGSEGDESPRQLAKEALPSKRRKSEGDEDDEVQGDDSELGKALPSLSPQSLATAAPSWAPWLARSTAAGAGGNGVWPSAPTRRWQAAMSPSEKRDLDMMFRQQERQVGRPARVLDINKAKKARQRNRQRKEASVADAEGSPFCDLDPEELLRLLGEAPPTNPPSPSPRRSKRRTKRRRKAPALGTKQQTSQEHEEEGEKEEVVERLIDNVASVLTDSKERQEMVNIVEDAEGGAEESEEEEEEEEEKDEASPSTSSRGSAAIASEDASEELTRRDVGVQAGTSKLHTVAWQLQDELDVQRRRPSNATSGDGRETEIVFAIEATSHTERNTVASVSSTRGQVLSVGSASAWRTDWQQSWADIADTDEEEAGSCAAIPAAATGCSSPNATSSVLRHMSCEEEPMDDTPEPEDTPEPAIEECQKNDCSKGKVQAGSWQTTSDGVSQPRKTREAKATFRGKSRNHGSSWNTMRQSSDRGNRRSS